MGRITPVQEGRAEPRREARGGIYRYALALDSSSTIPATPECSRSVQQDPVIRCKDGGRGSVRSMTTMAPASWSSLT